MGYISNTLSDDNIMKDNKVCQSKQPFNSDYRRGLNDKATTPRVSTAIPKRLNFSKGECSTPPLPGVGRG
ncbi:hypothetical protein A2U01_0047552, partial [Trifolium medium]|nr:hypothetical protein [Trifolium medium]